MAWNYLSCTACKCTAWGKYPYVYRIETNSHKWELLRYALFSFGTYSCRLHPTETVHKSIVIIRQTHWGLLLNILSKTNRYMLCIYIVATYKVSFYTKLIIILNVKLTYKNISSFKQDIILLSIHFPCRKL